MTENLEQVLADTALQEALEPSQAITHEGVTFDLSKAQDAPTGALQNFLGDAQLVGSSTKSKFGDGGFLSQLNRATRRKLAAFEKSAKWKRMLRNGDNAAVRKLNAEGRAFQAAYDKYGDPQD